MPVYRRVDILCADVVAADKRGDASLHLNAIR